MSHPGVEKGYALDFVSVIRHVATELDRAAPAALSVDDLAGNYRHIVRGDLSRVRHHHELPDDKAAIRFLVERALAALNGQVTENGSGYHLAKPFDELKYDQRKISRIEDPAPWPGGRGALDPMTHTLADMLDRKDTAADDKLRESMRDNGWLPDLPAIVDERGFVLVGNRRTRIAAELGIPPVTRRVQVGSEGGDSGEAARLRLAIASNLGTAKMTKANRQRIARHLYGGEDWSQERIAEALNVSVSQVSEDVRGVSRPGNSKGQKGGRPRTKMTPQEIEEAVRRYDAGESAEHMASDFPVGKDAIQRQINYILGERAKATEAAAPQPVAEPKPTPKPASAPKPKPAAPEPSAQKCRCPNCGDEHDHA